MGLRFLDASTLTGISDAIRRGFQFLISSFGSGSWKFEHPHIETQIVDTMQVFEFLAVTLRSSCLKKEIPESRALVLQAFEQSLSLQSPTGMPATSGSRVVAGNATIGTLFALTKLRGVMDPEVEKFVLIPSARRCWPRLAVLMLGPNSLFRIGLFLAG